MKKQVKEEKKQKIKRDWIFWTPRILSIIFILFLALFSLDTFGNNYTFWQTVLGLLMHNIPSMVLAIILWISWKREIVGAVAFVLAGLLYILSLFMGSFEWYKIAWALQISGPAFFIGILFWLIGKVIAYNIHRLVQLIRI